MKRVAIYMRVSSDKQAQEGDSIPAQRTALRKYIDDHDDMICVGEYLDDGISGTKEDRDELQRMLSDVKAGKTDLILVTKLDRLYRSIRHYLNLQDTLDRCGVNWLAIWEPIYDTSTPQGRLIINQMMSIAQFEAENTGQRIRQVQAYKVSKGEAISGSTPPGLRIVNKHIVPDENAPIVRQMFEYYSRCGNMDQTMRAFDHHGIFPRTKGAYKQILMNSKYIGVFRDNDHFCEPILPRALFEDVQRKVKMNVKASQRETYIFSGLLKCGECGRVLGANTRRKKNGREVYIKQYRCPGHFRSIPQCHNTKVMTERCLERYLLETVRAEMQGKVYRAEIERIEKPDHAARIAAIDRKVERLKELYVNDLITLDEYKHDRERMLSEQDALRAAQNDPAPDLDALREFLSLPFEDIYTTLSDDEKRYMWRAVIKEIKINANKDIQTTYLS